MSTGNARISLRIDLVPAACARQDGMDRGHHPDTAVGSGQLRLYVFAELFRILGNGRAWRVRPPHTDEASQGFRSDRFAD